MTETFIIKAWNHLCQECNIKGKKAHYFLYFIQNWKTSDNTVMLLRG